MDTLELLEITYPLCISASSMGTQELLDITYPLCISGSSIGTQELACNTALVMAFF